MGFWQSGFNKSRKNAEGKNVSEKKNLNLARFENNP